MVLVLAGCSGGGSPTATTEPVTSPNPGDGFASLFPGVTVVAALPTECPHGGSVVVSFLDANRSGGFDADDTEISRAPVCNGAPGASGEQGFGAGILVETAPVLSCPAGGARLLTFSDKNNNGLLDGNESIGSLTTVCNGTAGRGAHLSVQSASRVQCPAGGFVYTSGVDGQPTPDVTVVCNGPAGSNGSNGQNATFQMGAVGPEVEGRDFSACHHDYLFIPDSNSGERGWLTFRHQRNGASDQGIGATGFQIWNVDIPSFVLQSEVGAVSYCSLQWDAARRALSFQVIDNTDGLAGTTGTIQLR